MICFCKIFFERVHSESLIMLFFFGGGAFNDFKNCWKNEIQKASLKGKVTMPASTQTNSEHKSFSLSYFTIWPSLLKRPRKTVDQSTDFKKIIPSKMCWWFCKLLQFNDKTTLKKKMANFLEKFLKFFSMWYNSFRAVLRQPMFVFATCALLTSPKVCVGSSIHKFAISEI
jgi:hypothetical protein